MNLHHVPYRPDDTDVLAVARAAASGEPQVLERLNHEFLLFAPLHYLRQATTFEGRTLCVMDERAERADLDRTLWTGWLLNTRHTLSLTVLFMHDLAPLAVLHGCGDPADLAGRCLGLESHTPSARPRSVLDSLRGAPLLEDGDLTFARDAEPRVPDFGENV